MARPDSLCPAASGVLRGFLQIGPEPDPREPHEAKLDDLLGRADDLMTRARQALDSISEGTFPATPVDTAALAQAIAKLEIAVLALEAA